MGNNNNGVNILIIPDSHAHPKYDNDRMLWLGEYILSERPDVVLHIGDMADMPSLSSYDFGTMKAWGRFYREDIAAGIEHQEFLWRAVDKYNEQQKRNKKGQYRPRRVWVEGNHEERAHRFIQRYPQFDGFVDIQKDLELSRFWDEIVPFGEEILINGMGFTHYYRSGSGRAIAGVVPARSMVLKKSRSVVQGHNHKFSLFFQDRGLDMPKIQGYSVGYYGHPEARETWNAQEFATYDFGVLMLYDVRDGMAHGGHRWITMDALEAHYATATNARQSEAADGGEGGE